MLKRFKGAAIAVSALVITSSVLYAAGNYSAYPIVGGASFCLSTVGVNGQQGNTGQGGGAAGTAGSYCAQTVPAGPSIVTGTELIPADTGLAGGAPPQTVVLSLASLNALPLTVSTVTAASVTLPAASTSTPQTSGGYMLHLGSGVGTAMTAVTINFPAAPIDGQQFAISGDASVTTLTLTALNLPANVKISLAPTALTATNAVLFGYRFMYTAALNQWSRLQ